MTQLTPYITELIAKHGIVGFTYEADIHCVLHTLKRFGVLLDGAKDEEGNDLHPVFSLDDPGDPANLDGPGLFASIENPTGSHCSECIYESVVNLPGG